MKRNRGSILVIVLILIVSLYLLAGMMFVVNRQYLADLDMVQEASMNRQKLLRAGQKFIEGFEVNEHHQNIIGSCDLFDRPEYLYDDEQSLFYQYARLPERCYGHESVYRLWLLAGDGSADQLIMDWWLNEEPWFSAINDQNHKVGVVKKNESWFIDIENLELNRESLVFISDNERVLKYQAMRSREEHYELVLVFENKLEKQSYLYHLWIPISTAHFDEKMIVDLPVDIHIAEHENRFLMDKDSLLTHSNWRLVLNGQRFESMTFNDNALFMTTNNFDSNYHGIIGFYLSGETLFFDSLLGLERKMDNAVIELMPCTYWSPLIIKTKWQVGCIAKKKVRYHFAE